MSEVNNNLVEECKDLLLDAKQDILNSVQSTKENLNTAVE